MSTTLLSAKTVGSTVYIKENGEAVPYLVIHQGLPSSIYDASCTGTWLLRKNIAESYEWNSIHQNDYSKATVHSYLQSTFLTRFSTSTLEAIQTAKLPYRSGYADDSNTISSGSSGVSSKVFLLSGLETGLTAGYLVAPDGVKLSYFTTGTDSVAGERRIAVKDDGVGGSWWTRSPRTLNENSCHYYNSTGTNNTMFTTYTCGLRPALIFPDTLTVYESGNVALNEPPEIFGLEENIGRKYLNFQLPYRVTDDDELEESYTTVVEKIDQVEINTFQFHASVDKNFTMTDEQFEELEVGEHILTVEATDSNGNVTTFEVTFYKMAGQLELTFEEPLICDERVTLGSLTLKRHIPEGVTFTVEACNNGNDEEPNWEDVTAFVEHDLNFILENETKTAEEWGYNIRIRSDRNQVDEECRISYIGGYFK